MIEIQTSSLKDTSKSIGNYNAAKENNKIGISALANKKSERDDGETAPSKNDNEAGNAREVDKRTEKDEGKCRMSKKPKEQKKGLLRIFRFTESISEYMCSNQDLEALADSPYNAPDQACNGGGCMCCGQCKHCLNVCTEAEMMNAKSVKFRNEVEVIRQNFEYEINMLMSIPGNASTEWRDTFCNWFTEERVVNEKKAITSSSPKEWKTILCRNRSQIIDAREKKIKRLRSQMHFSTSRKDISCASFDKERNEDSQGKDCAPIRMVRSEDEVLLLRKSRSMDGKDEDNVEDQISRVIMSTFSLGLNAPHVKPTMEDEFYYDSDPETYNETQQYNHHVKHLDLKQMKNEVSEMDGFHEQASWSVSLNNDLSYEDDIDSVQISNPDLLSSIIQEITTKTTTLVWHPSRKEQGKDLSPVCVQAWFEMGSRLQSRLIQPKFMWRDAYEQDGKQSKVTASTAKPHDVELLNIVRVLKPESIDRNEYPFMKLGNSFSIHSSMNEVFMFECTSQNERDRFVHGLKLVVARLASKIIVGDEHVFEEFFTPYGNFSSHLVDSFPNEEDSSSNDVFGTTDSSSVDLNSSDSVGSRDLLRAYPVSSTS